MRRFYKLKSYYERQVIRFNIKSFAPVEHKSDGSLPSMTARQRQIAIRLIRNLCSNYFHGNCLALDDGDECICIQSISYSVNCKFFRNVLLNDKDGFSLKAVLFKDDSIKKCNVCNKVFQSSSNNAKYCENCKKNVHRKQKAKSAKNRRLIVDK